MVKRGVVCVVLAGLMVCACAKQEKPVVITDPPSDVEMRAALKDLLDKHPDLAIPEFTLSIADSPAVRAHGLVRIGSFDCDPDDLSFEASFSAPNLTMQQLEGRFERDARNNWRAVVVRSSITNARDPSRRADWYPGGTYSWSKPAPP